MAMLLIIVYVGAVAVLFLFVVMMLDIDFASLRGEMARYFPIAAIIGVVLMLQMAMLFGGLVQQRTGDGPAPSAHARCGRGPQHQGAGDDYL